MTHYCAMQVSILERTWRWAWRRKGDVYHLLFDMCRYVDGRVWPSQDKTDVLLFLSLMHHVTGLLTKSCTKASALCALIVQAGYITCEGSMLTLLPGTSRKHVTSSCTS